MRKRSVQHFKIKFYFKTAIVMTSSLSSLTNLWFKQSLLNLRKVGIIHIAKIYIWLWHYLVFLFALTAILSAANHSWLVADGSGLWLHAYCHKILWLSLSFLLFDCIQDIAGVVVNPMFRQSLNGNVCVHIKRSMRIAVRKYCVKASQAVLGTFRYHCYYKTIYKWFPQV